MITQQDKFNIVNNVKSHTSTTVYENQKKHLPVFNTGRMFNTKKYHYNDRWYTYAYSDDEPYKAYGIIYAENLPYKSLFKRREKMSFMARLDRMVNCNEIEPFLLFINNRFVPWDCIDIIHDFDDTYLRIRGYKYSYFDINDVKMLILPYRVSYVGVEDDYTFNTNYEALHDYIQSSASIIDNKLHIDVPTYTTDHMYNGVGMNVGAWMYYQLKLRHLGLLSEFRINKLRNIKVDLFDYNDNGDPIATYNTVFNIFDTDSYDHSVYANTVSHLSKKNYKDRAIFRFNSDGLLDNNGEYMICLIDEETVSMQQSSSINNTIYNIYSSIENEICEDNFIVFKNGMICTDYSISLGPCNTSKIYNIANTVDYTADGKVTSSKVNNSVVIKVFYDNNIEKIENNSRMFPNREYINQLAFSYFKSKSTNREYIKSFTDPIDFKYDDHAPFDDNYNMSFETVLQYNPNLFNDLYKTDVISTTMSGKEINEWLDKPVDYITRRGLKIPKMRYEDHETYVMVFVNGILIENYCDMVMYPNIHFIPKEDNFADDDQIEFMYFINCNNNEIPFEYTAQENIYERVIPKDDLKIFSTDIDDLLLYPEFEYDKENISFPVYKRTKDGLSVISDSLMNRQCVAVSSKRFAYQHLVVDRKAYKIRLGRQFKYCDNQRQYWLFINGRRMLDDTFLITIPKNSRPFDHMYIYLTKFVTPEDRVELFYVPRYFENINEDLSVSINPNGYLECDKSTLQVPYNNRLYMFFINGKKICPDSLLNVSTNSMRFLRDTKTTHNLIVHYLVDENIPEITEYIQTEESKLDAMINTIKEMYGYSELDTLLNQSIKITNTEDNALVRNVGKIAIINEIIRDFWVTSGYNYQDNPFIYDYELDQFMVKDKENGIYVMPSMDARNDINIIKYGLHTLFFQFMDNQPEYFELGTVISNPIFTWEYNDNYNTKELDYQKFEDTNLDINLREYQVIDEISSDKSYTITASNKYHTCESTVDIKFCNSIYYGFVDEDTLDGKDSDIYTDHPSDLLHAITKSLQPKADLDLLNTVINNNRYFIYALPKRLVYNSEGKEVLTFYLPDIKSKEVLDANNDDKTTPILTNGEFNSLDNSLIALDSYEMEVLKEFDYTNDSGYTEPYVIYKSNGFFTRLYDNTKFNIIIRGEVITNMFS